MLVYYWVLFLTSSKESTVRTGLIAVSYRLQEVQELYVAGGKWCAVLYSTYCSGHKLISLLDLSRLDIIPLEGRMIIVRKARTLLRDLTHTLSMFSPCGDFAIPCVISVT